MPEAVYGFGFRIWAKDVASKVAKKTARAVNSLGDKMKLAAKKAKAATREFFRFRRSANAAGKSAGGMAGKMKYLIAALVTFMAIRIGKGMFTSLIDTGSEAEMQLIVLTSVLGDSQAALEAFHWATIKAAETPFEIPEVIEAFTKLTAYGIDAEKHLDLMGDMALSMGKSLEDAVYAVSLAAQGQIRSLREQFAVATPELQKFTAGLTAGSKEYSEAVINFLYSIDRFQGGMKKAQGTAAVVGSNIEDFMHRMRLAVVGLPDEGRLFDSWKNLLKNILNRFESMEERVAIIMRGIGQVIGHVVDMVSRVMSKMFDKLETWVNRVSASFEDQKKTVYPFILFMEMFALKVENVIDRFLMGWRRGAEGINVVRESLRWLFPDIHNKTKEWGSFAEAVGQVASSVLLLGAALDLLMKPIEGLVAIWNTLWGVVDETFVMGRLIFEGDPVKLIDAEKDKLRKSMIETGVSALWKKPDWFKGEFEDTDVTGVWGGQGGPSIDESGVAVMSVIEKAMAKYGKDITESPMKTLIEKTGSTIVPKVIESVVTSSEIIQEVGPKSGMSIDQKPFPPVRQSTVEINEGAIVINNYGIKDVEDLDVDSLTTQIATKIITEEKIEREREGGLD